MRKVFCSVCFFLSIGLLSAQDVPAPGDAAAAGTSATAVSAGISTAGFLEVAKAEFLAYFRRYRPIVVINGDRVQGSAAFGKYPVTAVIYPTDNGNFAIEIVSNVKQSYIDKWEANLRKNIRNRL